MTAEVERPGAAGGDLAAAVERSGLGGGDLAAVVERSGLRGGDLNAEVAHPGAAGGAWSGRLFTAWADFRWRRRLLKGLRDPRRHPEQVRALRVLIDTPLEQLSTDWLWRVQALAEKALTRLPVDDPLIPDLERIFQGALWTVQNRARAR